MSRSFAVPLSIYLGSGVEGLKLLKALEAHCEANGLSVSEFVKGLIIKELTK